MIRDALEESRERLVALTLLLQSATRQRPLTQETIVSEMLIDEYPVRASGPRKVRAYQGGESAIRQKFERDKAKIRELGMQIETVVQVRLARPVDPVGETHDPAPARLA